MRLGRYESRPVPALGDDQWEVVVEDSTQETGRRRIAVLGKAAAEGEVVRKHTADLFGSEYVSPQP
jgi:hypothetical protein